MIARPLAGEVVLCLGGPSTVPRLATRIRSLGGTPLPASAFDILPGDRLEVRNAIRAAGRSAFVALCLTSSAGAASVAREARVLRVDPARAFRNVVVGSVGPGTTRAIADQLGLVPDIEPTVSTGEALGRAFPRGEGRALQLVSDLASGSLGAGLRSRGYAPVRVTAYRNRCVTALPATVDVTVRRGSVALVALTSPSTARAYVRLVDAELRAGQLVVSIGPSTSAACADLGVAVVAEAQTHDLAGVAEALGDAARRHAPVQRLVSYRVGRWRQRPR